MKKLLIVLALIVVFVGLVLYRVITQPTTEDTRDKAAPQRLENAPAYPAIPDEPMPDVAPVPDPVPTAPEVSVPGIAEVEAPPPAPVDELDLPATIVEAVSGGRPDVVARVIDGGADVNLRNEEGRTAVMIAAGNADEDMVAVLLEKGADVNMASPSGGTTALMLAARAGNRNVVNALLEAGADPEIADARGRTASDYAADAGHQRIAHQLRVGDGGDE